MLARAAAVATVVLTAGLGACSFSPGGGRVDDRDGAIGDDANDVDGASAIDAALDGPPVVTDACESVCASDDVVSCGATIEHCAAGCSPTGGAHCRQLVPSNGVTVADDLDGAGADLVLMADRLYILDTDTGAIRHYPLDGSGGGAQVRAAGVPGLDGASGIRWRTLSQSVPVGSRPAPDLSIFGVRSLSIPQNAVLRPIGSRAAVIVARGAIDIAGEIDVGAGRLQDPQGGRSLIVPGPGGGRGAFDSQAANAAQGCAPGGNGVRANAAMQHDTGGGGGGLGTAGGKGGPASATIDLGGTAVALASLPTVCAQTNLVPLRGGSGGGCSRDGTGGNVTGGSGGGGALQLTSLASISIMDGSLYAGGAGGSADGEASGAGADGGGGAGAGGGLLLEAPTITLMAGSLTATGGGGGAGNGNASAGENGRRTGEPAQGSGNGGDGATGGGAGESAAQDGGGDVDGTGGGGGGAGLVHFRSLHAATVMGGAIIRPAPSTSTATTTD